MLRYFSAVIAVSAAFSNAVQAAATVDVTECAVMLEADEARLACYDRIVLGEIKKQLENSPSVAPKVSATLQTAAPVPADLVPVKPFSERSFKRLDPADVRNTPDKWKDRDIEFATAQVYWVSDSDLRVLTKENMTLFGRKPLGSNEDVAYLRENCETSKEASSAKCRVRVRFNYNRHSEDNPGGMYKRVVLVAPEVEFVRLGKGRR